MHFIETPIFTSQVQDALTPDSYRALQLAIALRPEQGALIRGSGGLRKIRWAGSGTGRRGGLRVLYFWDKPNRRVFFLFLYPKSRTPDLSLRQIGILRKVVEKELT